MISGTVRIKSKIKLIGHDNLSDLFVAEAIPNTVRSHNNCLVSWLHVLEDLDLRLRSHADAARDKVTDGPRHRQAGHLFVLQPDAIRSVELHLLRFTARERSRAIQQLWSDTRRLDSTATLEDASRLVR